MRLHEPTVKVKQWGRTEYDDDFLEAVIEHIAAKIPDADGLNFLFEFRKKMSQVCGVKHAEGVHHFDPNRNLHVIALDKCLIDKYSLEYMLAAIAHEIGHAVQRANGRLRWGQGRTGIWDGEAYSYDLPWEDRPWEIDAIAYEHYGEEVYQELERQQLIPHTKSKLAIDRIYAKHPNLRPPKVSQIKMEDLPDDLTRDQLLALHKLVQGNPDATLEELLERVGY
jgi:hypothetical protein